MAPLPRSPRNAMSKYLLEEQLDRSKSKLEEAILASANIDRTSEQYVSDVKSIAIDLKTCSETFEKASRNLQQWLKTHGCNDEERRVRQERHKLIYGETKECLGDLNVILSTLHQDTVSNVGSGSIFSEVVQPNRNRTQPSNLVTNCTQQDEDVRTSRNALVNIPNTQFLHGAASNLVQHTPTNVLQRPQSSHHILKHQNSKTVNFSTRDMEIPPLENLLITPSNIAHSTRHSQPGSLRKTLAQQSSEFMNSAIPEPWGMPSHSQVPPTSRAFVPPPSSVQSLTYQNQPTPFVTNNQLDHHTRHLVKQDLLRGGSNKFNGDAQNFISWKANLQRRLDECCADSLDSIHIILANSTGRPNTMVQRFLSAGISDPDTTLKDIWDNLQRRFATPEIIAEGLISKVNTSSTIRNANDIFKLEDLLDLCKIIHSSMTLCPELAIFNLSHGMKSVWEKLPESFQDRWRSRYIKHEDSTGLPPDFGIFIEFFENYVKTVSHPSFVVNNKQSINRNIRAFVTETETTKPKCSFHNIEGHSIVDCKSFSKLPFNERKQFASINKLCFSCLGNHFSNKCANKSNIQCSKCKMPHVDAMHLDRPGNFNNVSSPLTDPNNEPIDNDNPFHEINNSCTMLCGDSKTSKICSKTLLVDLAVEGQPKTLRCLAIIDEQSNASFCDPDVATYFNLRQNKTEYTLATMTSKRSVAGSLISGLKVKGVNTHKWLELPPLLTHPNLPDTRKEMATPGIVASHPHIREFADQFPLSNSSFHVMLLIGADAGQFMETKTHGAHFPYVHETPLGFALVGPSCVSETPIHPTSIKTLRTSVDYTPCEHHVAKIIFKSHADRICKFEDSTFKSYLDDELPGLSQEDVKFTQLMEREITINEKGNLQLPLPLKEGFVLPNNRIPVFYRTKNTLERLRRSPDKLKSSTDIFDKYLRSGHVERVTDSTSNDSPANYIPIFPIFNEGKKKTRLVFDSSASFHGASLNDALMQGPDFNNSLIGVLLRFRLGEVAINADIENMFHAFHVDPRHINQLRFFWYKDNNPSSDIVEYRALVHIFGNKASPAIANFALKYTTFHPDAQNNPDVCDLIKDHFYVDDVLYSTDSVTKAIDILNTTRNILNTYNIRLHKILSSHNAVMEAFPVSELNSKSKCLDLGSDEIQNKTLGITWSPISDQLSLTPKIPTRPFTKRGVLAIVSSIYDPIGFVSPVVLRGRLLQRQIIPSKDHGDPELDICDWDDPLPLKFFGEWNSWTLSLRQVDSVVVPRCYRTPDFGPVVVSELHCFCDASDLAIGYVVYLRQINSSGEVSVGFVLANSKVAPRAANTVPRLELCAAVEAAKAARMLTVELKINLDSIKFYTDSRIVLGYVHNAERRFTKYVSRRIEEITKFSSADQWSYVEGSNNIGDLASRPQSIQALVDSNWFSGPEFLHSSTSLEDNFVATKSDDLPENKCLIVRESHQAQPKCIITDHLCYRTNSWLKAKRILALVFRFIHSLRYLRGRKEHNDSDFDLQAESFLIKGCQIAFSREKETILVNKSLSPTNPLSSLNPFVDDVGVIRVGGRLKQSSFPGDVKYPILLPSTHPITVMIMRDCHLRVNHQGRHLTAGCIRQNGYHIHKGSSVLKKFIHSCVTCRKLRGQCQQQMMSDLPPDRLEEHSPFTNVGVDLFGPYLVHDGMTTRSHKATKKVWGLLVTCLVSRAIHVELLPFLDTSSLQLGMRRFYALRGTCKLIRSDQGTNLVGARNQILDIEQLRADASKHGVRWELNPPAASNMAGVWERKIGAVKRILDCTLLLCGKTSLSRDELNTYLQECVSIVNNTPLWEVSNHPDDPAPLSPANLLTLRDCPNPTPLENFTKADILSYGKNRWRRVLYLCEQFWCRWRSHYLNNLQTRSKWKKPNHQINVGDVVLVKGTSKRNEWPVGRISSVKVSPDGLVRSVVIRLSGKDWKHPRFLERSVRDTVLLVSSDDPPNEGNTKNPSLAGGECRGNSEIPTEHLL